MKLNTHSELHRVLFARIFLVATLASGTWFFLFSYFVFGPVGGVIFLLAIILLVVSTYGKFFTEPSLDVVTDNLLLPEQADVLKQDFGSSIPGVWKEISVQTGVTIRIIQNPLVNGQTFITLSSLRNQENHVVQICQGAWGAKPEILGWILLHEFGHLRRPVTNYLTKLVCVLSVRIHDMVVTSATAFLLLPPIIILFALFLAIFPLTAIGFGLPILGMILLPVAASRQLEFGADAYASNIMGSKSAFETLKEMSDGVNRQVALVATKNKMDSQQYLKQLPIYLRASVESSLIYDPHQLGFKDRLRMVLSTHPTISTRIEAISSLQDGQPL